MAGKCVLFTGTSGLNIDDSLENKFLDHCRRRGQPSRLVILDGAMIERHLEKYTRERMKDRMRAPGGFQFLLLLPKEYLLKLWCDSVKAVLSPIAKTEENIFLFVHSVFYHTGSRDFFNCVDLGHLCSCLAEKGLQIDIVITLMDDIYDVWRRLKEPGQLFEISNDLIHAILDLLLLLHWRSMEIFASAGIARQLKKPHFLLAMKHPLSVAYDLIFSEKITLYLAHPITEVRRLEQRGNTVEANALKAEIQELTNSFVTSRIVCPILPTSIDEFIINQDSTGRFLPELLPRWPYPNPRNILFVPPRSTVPNPFDLPGPMETEAMGLLITGLAEAIEAQISSRDRMLVEQTKALVAWRPYYNGHPSSGVDNEIAHRNKLIEYGLVPKEVHPAIVLSRLNDLGLYRIDTIYELLHNRAEKLPSEVTQDWLRQRLGGTLAARLSHEKGELSPDELLATADPNGKISFRLDLRKKGALRTAIAEQEARTEAWQEIASEANQSFPPYEFRHADKVLYDDTMTIAEFLHLVEDILEKIKEEDK